MGKLEFPSGIDPKLVDAAVAEFERYSPEDQAAVIAHLQWLNSAYSYQVHPPLADLSWNVWLLLGGRGAGKTRTGVETLWWWAWTDRGTRWLVLSPTQGDLRKTDFEGESGLLAKVPPILIESYNKQDFLLVLKNGSQIQGISGDSYERLRGPQFHGAFVDELAAFQYLGDGEAWDTMNMGVRLGAHPRIIVATTPRPIDLIVQLVDRDDVIVDRASTYANKANLAPNFIAGLERYRGTKLFQQEVMGEIIDLEEGKVLSRKDFRLWPHNKAFPTIEFIVQTYDCAFSEKEHNDPTACQTWGVFKPEDGPMGILLLDCWQEHLSFPDLKPRVIEEFSTSYGEGKTQKRPNLILVEEKAAGISLIQELQRAHLPVRPYNPGRADKMMRFQIAATAAVARRVWVPESAVRRGYVRDWAEGMVSQLCSFPDSAHDDHVDAAAQCWRYLMDAGYIDINPAPREDDDDWYADDATHRRRNPYDA